MSKISKDIKLDQCECLTEYEKDTLITALNSASIDAQRTLQDSYRGINVIGTSPRDVRKGLERLISDYLNLKNKIDKTPVCH